MDFSQRIDDDVTQQPEPSHAVAHPAEVGTLTRLRGLLSVARLVGSGEGLHALLEAIAAAVAESLGFRSVIVNLYRPAWDDYEVAVVHGSAEALEQLLGTTMSHASWDRLLDERFVRCGGAYLLPHGEYEWPEDDDAVYVPDLEIVDDPGAWHPDDGLFVPMRAADGRMIGVISVDEPVSGRRPSEADLEVLVAVGAHAAIAVEHAQDAARAERHRTALDHLLRVSSVLQGELSAEAILDAVCQAVKAALGFQNVAVFLEDARDGRIRARACAGCEETHPALAFESEPAVVRELLAPRFMREGCALLTDDEARAIAGGGNHVYSSELNGRGPHAWNHHWLLVPLYERDGSIGGFLWADDPEDRLLPTIDCLQALRVFANQATAALESARQLDALRYLAEHDPLTGLRNRREMQTLIDARIAAPDGGAVSLVVLDLDHFKRINDRFGHSSGDATLQRLARLIDEFTRDGDLTVRLGGEEFALVLPGTDEEEARAIAERLRRRIARTDFGHGQPLTASIGIATSGREIADAQALLRCADQALYVAKHLGRDRSVAYSRRAIAALPETDAPADDQLSTVLMLAEMLDLRDDSTSRHSQTVGRYCEAIARQLGWDATRVERIRIAGLLHDVGKIGVADAILLKPGRLSCEEWAEMHRHPELGAEMLAKAGLPDISDWVLAHHERVDGGGYPNGLVGDDIPVHARILAVADAYEAMTCDRPYRGAISHETAQAELRACAGTQFDPDVISAFQAVLEGGDRTGASLPGAIPG